MSVGTLVDRRPARDAKIAQRFHAAVALFRCAGPVLSQSRTVDTGAFHSHPDQVAEPAHPIQQRRISFGVGGEHAGPQDPADGVEHGGGVSVLVGIDSADDLARRGVFVCNGAHRRPVTRQLGRAARTSRARGQDRDGASGQAPMKSQRHTQ